MPGQHKPYPSHLSAANHQRFPDNGQRKMNYQNGPRPSFPSNPKPVNYSPGYMVMLPKAEDVPIESIPMGIDPGIFFHPALIIEECGESIVIAIATTCKGRSFENLQRYMQLQHLPISPASRAETGEQLRLKNNRQMHQPVNSYIKAHETFTLQKKIIARGNCDKITGEQLEMEEDSLRYVKQLVKEYEGTGPSDWPRHQSCRPFRGYSDDIVPAEYLQESPTSSTPTSSTSESLYSSLDSLQSSSTGPSTADNTLAQSLLPDSGTTEDNRGPSEESAKASPSTPPPVSIRVACQPPPQGQLHLASSPETSVARGDYFVPPPPRYNNIPPWRQKYEPYRPQGYW